MMMQSLSVPSLILGFHVIYGVLTGFKMSAQASVSTTTRQPETPKLTTSIPTPTFPLPRLPNILQRRMDLQRMAPRRKHLKPERLLKRMGKDYDSFWMSHETPKDYLTVLTDDNLDASLRADLPALDLTGIATSLTSDLSLNTDLNLNANETADNNNVTSGQIQTVVRGLEEWLVRRASCPVAYVWEDMGLLYWPRWVRKSSCLGQDVANPFGFSSSASSSSSSSSSSYPPCSWPPGMHCVSGKEKKIKVLRWNCKYTREKYSFKRLQQSGRGEMIYTTTPQPKIFSKQTTTEQLLYDDDHNIRESVSEAKDDRNKRQRDIDTVHTELGDQTRDKNTDQSEFIRQFLLKKSESQRARPPLKKSARDTTLKLKKNPDSEVLQNQQDVHVDSTADDVKTTSLAELKNFRERVEKSIRNKRRARRRHSNKTARQSKGKRSGRGRSHGLRCRWVKVVLPRVSDCFCSC